ncbi:LacI family DNA-binding transcriptional regulator [Sinomonas sp. ASV322]|uniref:LacI family DNA-binding transcriptional regulator n=1 Tax=Sinomonas sp. ASV322 TaxID=3041920 RepID=UPI0027DE8D7F|nr:LacI family DNA-binding transcriptional regulator [Sinomonas sp. ASV322]MDQ4501545.1 LacI family DNA-binding transcriptional regulator [Sinomonas sp. ASV322]
MGRQGVTIRDVARRAGVSTAAVSFALNGTGTLSAATRERVQAVAGELGYQADALARGLRRSPMGAVGLVLRSLDALADYTPSGVDVFERFVGAAASRALARGLSLMLVPDLTRPPVPPLAFSMDGYIVTNPHVDDPVVRLLASRGIPYVTLGRDLSRPDFMQWASEDDAGSARLVLDHLAGQGARTVALVRGTDPNAWNADSEAAYRQWCAGAGVEPRVYEVPERAGVDGGRSVASRIAGDGAPDAVFCLTGRHAAGVLEGLVGLGVRVPERTMVAAGSDSEHARVSRPAISALEMNPAAATAALLELLEGLIAGEPAEGPRLVQARFHARASTRA